VSTKYHPGEIEVQERAGVRSMAERIGNSIRPTIPPAAREFLGEQPMVVVGSVGADGRVCPYFEPPEVCAYAFRVPPTAIPTALMLGGSSSSEILRARNPKITLSFVQGLDHRLFSRYSPRSRQG